MGSKKHALRNCVELDHEILEKNAVMELSLCLVPGGTGLELWKKGKKERKKEEIETERKTTADASLQYDISEPLSFS